MIYSLKNEKPTEQGSVGFSALGEEIRFGYWVPHGVMSSLLKILFIIQQEYKLLSNIYPN